MKYPVFVEVDADRDTFDKIMDVTLSAGGSVRDGMVLQFENRQALSHVCAYLVHCGVDFRRVDYEEPTISNAHRLEFALRIATLGRKAFGMV